MRPTFFFLAALLTSIAAPTPAQRLMWERTSFRNGAYGENMPTMYFTPLHQIQLLGIYTAPPTSALPCQVLGHPYYRTYDLNGTLLRERAGRLSVNANLGDVAAAALGGSWWPMHAAVCSSGPTYARPYLQRLSAAGDTLRGCWLAPTAAFAGAVLAQGNRLVTAGYAYISPTNRAQLTCTDTLGNVRWQYTYSHPAGQSNDACAALVRTPRGGYLLVGNASAQGTQHAVTETDSLGHLLKQRLYSPLGPAFRTTHVYDNYCNALALPNAQGYLLAAAADSTMGLKTLGYVLCLDTALNVRWVYRNPPRTNGNTNRSQYAYKIRFLPNNTVGVLLHDLRGSGSPDTYLVQVDLATGQRIGTPYTMSSNTQSDVVPYDWQWLGDGTLVLSGGSQQLGVTGGLGYVARWDFRGTPLAARTAAAARAAATFYAFPNPASGPVTLHWQLPPGQRAGAVRLYSLLGQLLRTVVLPPAAEGQQEVAGLAAGLYVARLVDGDGRGQGSAVRLEVRE